ncbi:twin-arginine translocase subunit TatC [Citricoccus sp.]|uniref:twin-arginine translocase subunit TatC n=1 Tax=Citricoccus sp. TaxID=1978372 RepID=UPI0028BEA5A2|nr:twin-arginine translocase subunit TatC [Citricoccus sp.]
MTSAPKAARPKRTKVTRASRKNNPAGEMALKDHLKELRNRLIIAGVGLTLGAIVGFIIYQPFFSALIDPVHRLSDEGRIVTVSFSAVGQPFDIMLQVALFVGLVISSPIWLYQVWAFVVPGLKKKEKRYALGFIGAAVPLFVLGVALGWLVLPEAVQFFVGLSPEGTANVISADVYIPFVLRLFLAFGFALVLPVALVGLNMIGVLPGRQIIKHWRITVFLIALIAALAAPGSDAITMFYLAMPLILLFGVAIIICLFNDKRRAKRTAKAEQDNEEYLTTGPASLDEL